MSIGILSCSYSYGGSRHRNLSGAEPKHSRKRDTPAFTARPLAVGHMYLAAAAGHPGMFLEGRLEVHAAEITPLSPTLFIARRAVRR